MLPGQPPGGLGILQHTPLLAPGGPLFSFFNTSLLVTETNRLLHGNRKLLLKRILRFVWWKIEAIETKSHRLASKLCFEY